MAKTREKSWTKSIINQLIDKMFIDVVVYDECVIIDDPNLNVQKCEIESI